MDKMIRVLIVNPQGDFSIGTLAPRLEILQQIVGGHLEPIAGSNGTGGSWIAYVNDEGKFTQPSNDYATALAAHLGWPGAGMDYLSGTVVFLGFNGADEASLPDDVLETALTFLGAETA